MFGRLGPVELILILVIALVIFGPSKLPAIGRSLGEAIQEFKKGTSKVNEELNSITNDTRPSAAPRDGAASKDDNRQA